ncbi:(deoxy)nucleoside triphosphate pyrophosphohydrolase [Labilibacter sediminis]|nr:(deoxy)nucleoside triphosphate pyrophosphohydrolase [Labilibacter sediminis]
MTLNVVCAIIIQNNKILAAKRSKNMPHPGFWEFPGGKIEDGENEKDCLIREIKEELNCIISNIKPIKSFTYSYPDKNIILKPFICQLKNQIPIATEHEQIKWLALNELNTVDWLPADIEIKNYIQRIL